jgi:hypothetical protein
VLRRKSGRRGRRLAAASLVVAVSAALTVGPFATSALAGRNCDPGNHCVFYTDFDSAKHQFFNPSKNFVGYTFDQGGAAGRGQPVNDNNWALSNSSTGNYYSVYYLHEWWNGGALVCVAPGASITADRMSSNGVRGDGIGQRDEASSLRLFQSPPNDVLPCIW